MTSCNNMVFGELGRKQFCVSVKTTIIGHRGKLVKGKENNLNWIINNYLLNLHNAGVYASPRVLHWMTGCGLSFLWLSQKCNNINRLKLTVKQRLKDQFTQKWQSELRIIRQAICNFKVSNTRIALEIIKDWIETR